MVKPISPDEVATQKSKDLPDIVMETWNSMIAQKFSNGKSEIHLKHIRDALAVATGETPFRVRELGYLDIEEIYREAGWSVVYDQPAYNETYDAFYIFKKK
jgi:hypothetical protein